MRRFPELITAITLTGLVLGVVGVGQVVLARQYAGVGAFYTADFTQYCEQIASVIEGFDSENRHRSIFVARLLAPLAARWGLLDGLMLGGLAGLLGVVAGVVIHAGAARGRLAAAAAALSVLVCAPLVLVGRTLSFYPAMSASFALAAAGAGLALARGSWWAVGLGAVAAFTAGLVDQRGLLWLYPSASFVLLGALLGPPGARWRPGPAVLRLALFALAGAWSWQAAREIWQEHVHSDVIGQMVGQINSVRLDGHLSQLHADAGIPACRNTSVIWGKTPLWELPRAAECLMRLGELQRAQRPIPESVLIWRRHVEPFLPVAQAAVGVVILRNLRAPRRLAALLLPLLPSVAALSGAQSEPELRRLELGFLWMPVVFGAAVEAVWATGAGVVDLALGRAGASDTVRTWVRRGLAAAALLLVVAVVSGRLKTKLNPYSWAREPFGGSRDPWSEVWSPGAMRTATGRACRARIMADRTEGKDRVLINQLLTWSPPKKSRHE